ncbi:hypothetical protein KAW18_04105 [candidate division WOR-3 bacterium]|nr:hypothetical protein [candidate division WOR-3 bacterium]
MKKNSLGFLAFTIGSLLVGCSALGPQAPLEDGLYLSYDFEGSTIRVTFTKINNNQFRATVDIGSEDMMATSTSTKGEQVVVNRQLKTADGTIFELEALGPLWIPPGSVKAGSIVYGDRVDEVKRWKGWDVGVVRASFGVGGAWRGEWYYEKTTGFLVGGSKSTAVSGEGGGSHFVLKETNLADLSL